MRKVMYNEYAKEALQGLSKGAFLNVNHNGEANTMTIGWGTIGLMWGKPVLTVAVRYSRHTYELLDRSGEFTVSVPLHVDLKKELGFCGTNSGRDCDKFTACNLTKENAHKVNAPIIGQCELHYECKVIYKQAMEPGLIDRKIDDQYYSNNDFHVLYYGEIIATYVK